MSERVKGKLVASSYEGGWDCIRDKHGTIICKLEDNNPNNAYHLVKCWNSFEAGGSHDALLEALKKISQGHPDGNPIVLIDIAEQAIAETQNETH